TGRSDLAGVHHEPGAAQVLGRVPVADPGEAGDELARMPAFGGQGQRAAVGRIGMQRGAHDEPAARVIRADLHGHVAADPVRPPDPADDQLHDEAGPAQRTSVESIRSTRTYWRPASEPMTVR